MALKQNNLFLLMMSFKRVNPLADLDVQCTLYTYAMNTTHTHTHASLFSIEIKDSS